MLYSLLHKVFGWDYLQWDNGLYTGISKIHLDGNGRPFYWVYKTTKVARTLPDRWNKIIFLTCPEEKYLQKPLDKS